jgi:hypothetical protein
MGSRPRFGRAAALALMVLAACAEPTLRLPRSTSDWRLDDAPGIEVRLEPGRLQVAGAPVLVLSHGQAPAGAFVDHLAPAVRDALAPHVETARRDAPVVDIVGLPGVRARVLADRDTPAGLFVDTLFTATHAGVVEIELVVDGDGGLRGIPLAVPLAWFPASPGRARTERPASFVLTVERRRITVAGPRDEPRTIEGPASCDPVPAVCHDLAAIDEVTAQWKRDAPFETVATLRIADDVPLQAVVTLIDALRGPGCRMADAQQGAAIPEECRFTQTIVDGPHALVAVAPR